MKWQVGDNKDLGFRNPFHPYTHIGHYESHSIIPSLLSLSS
jgi:hypothetical protein